MVRFSCFLIALLWLPQLHGQQITCAPGDSVLFENKLDEIRGIRANSLGDSIVLIGKSFLETPYLEKTLEVGDTETLVINFSGLDCTTFVENVLTFGIILKNDKQSFGKFASNLETIRYRNGELIGYPSRLHYFTEWIRNNESKGLVKRYYLNLRRSRT